MTSKYTKNRPAISSETKREVAIESGHSCAIKGCTEHTYNIYHHIDFNRENNNPDNLIYLCDKHHKMAHKGIIDKKSLREYKRQNSNFTGVSIKDEIANEFEGKIHIEDIRSIDVLEDKFIPNSKEMGIKLYEIWAENQYKYTQKDFSRILNIPENEIYNYFTGKITLSLQQILMVTEVFNLSKSYFFEGTYWTRKAYWKEDIVKYTILSLVYPKSKIANINNEGIFYSSILKSYAKSICMLHDQLFEDNEKKAIFSQENQRVKISSSLKDLISQQYYKVLEQYPDFDKTRTLLNYEKILRNWFFASGEYISRIIIEGIKNIDITDANNPVVTCRFDEDIKQKNVKSQTYNNNTIAMESA